MMFFVEWINFILPQYIHILTILISGLWNGLPPQQIQNPDNKMMENVSATLAKEVAEKYKIALEGLGVEGPGVIGFVVQNQSQQKVNIDQARVLIVKTFNEYFNGLNEQINKNKPNGKQFLVKDIYYS